MYEDLSESLIEAPSLALVLIDSAGTIVSVTVEAQRQFGYVESELLGRPVEILVPGRFRETHPEPGRSGRCWTA
jgi:PAS domain S-box-containing protein